MAEWRQMVGRVTPNSRAIWLTVKRRLPSWVGFLGEQVFVDKASGPLGGCAELGQAP